MIVNLFVLSPVPCVTPTCAAVSPIAFASLSSLPASSYAFEIVIIAVSRSSTSVGVLASFMIWYDLPFAVISAASLASVPSYLRMAGSNSLLTISTITRASIFATLHTDITLLYLSSSKSLLNIILFFTVSVIIHGC